MSLIKKIGLHPAQHPTRETRTGMPREIWVKIPAIFGAENAGINFNMKNSCVHLYFSKGGGRCYLPILKFKKDFL